MNSAINPSDIYVNVASGPAQRGMFRTGHWKAEYQGQEFTFYSSVSVRLSLSDQRKALERDAAIHLEKQVADAPEHRSRARQATETRLELTPDGGAVVINTRATRFKL